MTEVRVRNSRLSLTGALTAVLLTFWAAIACTGTQPSLAVDPLEDSARQRAMVDAIGAALAGPMKERTPEQALLLEMEDLYAPLTSAQRAFMERIRSLAGSDASIGVASGVEWTRITDQRARAATGERSLGLQLLPPSVGRAYKEMNAAMRRDLGRGLLLGSGYRSPANQLFVFVTYLPHFGYSVAETRPHVSLPGTSDHNRVERQGLDFVSETGVDLQYSDANAFEALDEYRWLQENAARFGFVPEAPGGASPWHWHWDSRKN